MKQPPVAQGHGSALERAAVLGALAAVLGAQLHTGAGAGASALLLLAAIVAADFVSGVVHWFFDTQVRPGASFLGRIAIDFQDHHAHPQRTLEVGFFKSAFRPAVFVASSTVGLAWIWRAHPYLASFVLWLGAFSIFAAQIHKLSHSRKVHPLLRTLQRYRILLHPRTHAKHHRTGQDGYYCITTGWCNAPLERVRFWRRLEAGINRVRRLSTRHRTAKALGLYLGLMALAAVCCWLWPQRLTTPLLQESIGRFLPESAATTPATHWLSLDWVVLDLLFISMIFVPLERMFGRVKTQPVLKKAWRTDLAHYLCSHLLMGHLIVVISWPALRLASFGTEWPVRAWIGAQSFWVQLALAALVAELAQYWIHRAFHQVPVLWRFHAVHHSSEELDWLSGSRLHLVDILLTRMITFAPLIMLGFAEVVVNVLLAMIALHAVFIHSNTRFRFRGLRNVITTPAYHHWHHASDPKAYGKNFGIALTLWDRIFRTHHLPRDAWPTRLGLSDPEFPRTFRAQVLVPFLQTRRQVLNLLLFVILAFAVAPTTLSAFPGDEAYGVHTYEVYASDGAPVGSYQFTVEPMDSEDGRRLTQVTSTMSIATKVMLMDVQVETKERFVHDEHRILEFELTELRDVPFSRRSWRRSRGKVRGDEMLVQLFDEAGRQIQMRVIPLSAFVEIRNLSSRHLRPAHLAAVGTEQVVTSLDPLTLEIGKVTTRALKSETVELLGVKQEVIVSSKRSDTGSIEVRSFASALIYRVDTDRGYTVLKNSRALGTTSP